MKHVIGSLFLAVSLSLGGLAQAAEDSTGQDYPPRELPVKPVRTIVTEHHVPGVIYLKLMDDSLIEPFGGIFVAPVDHEIPASISLRRILKHGHVERMITASSPEQLRQNHIIATRNLERNIADLSRWFEITIPTTRAELGSIIDQLNALEIVELAVPSPKISPEPITCSMAEDCETTAKQGYLYAPTASHGVNATAVWTSATGVGVKVTNIEGHFDAHSDHPYTITVLNSNNPAIGTPDHGTKTFGVLGARRQATKVGITGIAYGSTFFFASHEGSSNICDELDLARDAMSPGDVIVIEMQVAISGVNYVPVEYLSYNHQCIEDAIGMNYNVVMAAGNGDVNLDAVSTVLAPHEPFKWQNDSGAIVVGGGETATHERTGGGPGNASSYGNRVNVQGWGTAVLTTSSSSAFAEYSGTSSATAMVGGVVALVQSAFKASTGQVATPRQVRGALVLTGTPQGPTTASTHIGPLPNAHAAVQMLVASRSMPTSFTAQTYYCYGQGSLQWGPPDGGSYTYQLQASYSSSFAPPDVWFQYIGANQSTTVNVSQLTYFRVRACNANGCGAYAPSQFLIRYSACH